MSHPDIEIAAEAHGYLRRAAVLLGCPWPCTPAEVRGALPSGPGAARAAVEQADAAYWRLAMLAQRTAVYQAHRRRDGSGCPEDLTQEALLGLYDAAIRWDPDRGVRFATFARWWVRHRVAEHLATMHPGGRVTRWAMQQERQAHTEGREAAMEIQHLSTLRYAAEVHEDTMWSGGVSDMMVAQEERERSERQIAAVAVAIGELPWPERRRIRGRHRIGAQEGPAKVEDVEHARGRLREILEQRSIASRATGG